MSQGQAFWEREDWDELPYHVKAAEMNAFLQRVGFDPVEAQHQEERRRMQERIDALEHRVQMLELALKHWIDSETAARQTRIDHYRHGG